VQVLLGDLPANLTAQRLADGVWKSALIGLGLFAAAASAAVAGELSHALPGGQFLVSEQMTPRACFKTSLI